MLQQITVMDLRAVFREKRIKCFFVGGEVLCAVNVLERHISPVHSSKGLIGFDDADCSMHSEPEPHFEVAGMRQFGEIASQSLLKMRSNNDSRSRHIVFTGGTTFFKE